MQAEKIRGMLGLLSRAGQMQSGESQALALVRGGRAVLVLLDAGVSANTRKRFEDAASFRKVSLAALPQDMLGEAIGKPGRKVAACTAGSLAEQLMQLVLPDLP